MRLVGFIIKIKHFNSIYLVNNNTLLLTGNKEGCTLPVQFQMDVTSLIFGPHNSFDSSRRQELIKYLHLFFLTYVTRVKYLASPPGSPLANILKDCGA